MKSSRRSIRSARSRHSFSEKKSKPSNENSPISAAPNTAWHYRGNRGPALGSAGAGRPGGDEVITTSNTFLATVEAISYCGARPVLVDIDPATGNLDAKLLERAITTRSSGHIFQCTSMADRPIWSRFANLPRATACVFSKMRHKLMAPAIGASASEVWAMLPRSVSIRQRISALTERGALSQPMTTMWRNSHAQPDPMAKRLVTNTNSWATTTGCKVSRAPSCESSYAACTPGPRSDKRLRAITAASLRCSTGNSRRRRAGRMCLPPVCDLCEQSQCRHVPIGGSRH